MAMSTGRRYATSTESDTYGYRMSANWRVFQGRASLDVRQGNGAPRGGIPGRPDPAEMGGPARPNEKGQSRRRRWHGGGRLSRRRVWSGRG
jgi:hypothetical protein